MCVCLPTGSGKSLCCWIFDRLRGPDSYSIVIVVSSLKALMRERLNIKAGAGCQEQYVWGDALYEELVHDERKGKEPCPRMLHNHLLMITNTMYGSVNCSVPPTQMGIIMCLHVKMTASSDWE